MRSRKGFTLIELLAVIVILAVIALIATPIIMNVINDSKEGAAKDAMYGYVKAVELASAKQISPTTDAPDGNYTTTDGNLYQGSTKILDVVFKGTKPANNGIVTLSKGNVISATLVFDSITVTYNGKKAEISSKAPESGDISLVEGTAFAIGSKYKIGDSTWYTIASDSNTVTLLSEFNLSKKDNFTVQDKTEYTFTVDYENDDSWISVNAVAFEDPHLLNRNNNSNTYCQASTYYGCNIYARQSGNITNAGKTGTVTEDSSIKGIVDRYVTSLNLGSQLIEGRLIKKEELISLGCSEENTECPTEQYPWITSLTYWVMNPSNNDSHNVWNVISVPATFNFSSIDSRATADDVWGVRPVIKVKKAAF